MHATSLHDRCHKIEMLVMDVDGVLTDGSIVYTDQGAEIKAFHVRDGSGLKIWMAAGKKAGFAADMTTWGEAEIKLAREETKAFETKRREGTLKQVA